MGNIHFFISSINYDMGRHDAGRHDAGRHDTERHDAGFITRKIIKDKFEYYYLGKQVKNEKILNRIRKLHIPPKWNNIKISISETEYLQATGQDDKKRTQYIYHPVWIALSKIEKYDRLKSFSKKLLLLKNSVDTKLKGKIDLSDKEFIITLIIKILLETHSRIGNDYFAEENNTYGLTTLLKKHVTIENDIIYISFIGKKGIKQSFDFVNKTCSDIITGLKKIPGNRLFKTTNGDIITSNDINNYLKVIMEGEFTAKDFRTYAANNLFLKFILKPSCTQTIKHINNCYDKVAEELHHTRSVCKSSYVMPIISEKYLENPVNFIKNIKTLEDIFKLY